MAVKGPSADVTQGDLHSLLQNRLPALPTGLEIIGMHIVVQTQADHSCGVDALTIRAPAALM